MHFCFTLYSSKCFFKCVFQLMSLIFHEPFRKEHCLSLLFFFSFLWWGPIPNVLRSYSCLCKGTTPAVLRRLHGATEIKPRSATCKKSILGEFSLSVSPELNNTLFFLLDFLSSLKLCIRRIEKASSPRILKIPDLDFIGNREKS